MKNLDFDFERPPVLDLLNRRVKHQRRVRAEIPQDFCFDMYWMGRPVARLVFKDDFWTFQQTSEVGFDISENDRKGIANTNLPYFIESLMPEAWLYADPLRTIQFDPNCGDRYLSNIVLRPSSRKTPIIVDILHGRLKDFIDERRQFTGAIDKDLLPYADMSRDELNDAPTFGCLMDDIDAPKMSGCQRKIPAFLDADGRMTHAIGRSFTHIVKLESTGAQDNSIGSMEWYSTTLARCAGLKTEEFAIARLSEERPDPVFIAERFDIRTALIDNRAVLAEDMCSIMGVGRSGKQSKDLDEVFRHVYEKSTSPDEDVRALLRYVMYSWLIGNDDLHLKNMMMMKVSDGEMRERQSVRLAPLYDVMSTIFYIRGRVEDSAPALKIFSDLDSDYSLDLFEELGGQYLISAQEVRDMGAQLVRAIEENADKILEDLPQIVREHDNSMNDLRRLSDLFKDPSWRIASMKEGLERTARKNRRLSPMY